MGLRERSGRLVREHENIERARSEIVSIDNSKGSTIFCQNCQLVKIAISLIETKKGKDLLNSPFPRKVQDRLQHWQHISGPARIRSHWSDAPASEVPARED